MDIRQKKPSLKKKAYNYLKDAIINEKILNNTVYSEQYFADVLKISRTPVREAVLQLKQEGFVVIHKNRGFSVKEDTEDELKDMFQLRLAIEGYCAMRLCDMKGKNGFDETVSKLKSIVESEQNACKEGRSVTEYMEIDSMFHMELVKAANNNFIMDNMNNIRLKINLIGIKGMNYKEGRVTEAIKEHNEILHFIQLGESFKAYKSLENHFKNALSAFLIKK